MGSMTVRCPSGLTGVVRGLKVSEANILADQDAHKDGSAFDRILAACWLETTSTGSCSWFEVGKPVDWKKALLGDRFEALIHIRCATYGPSYEFKVKCQDEDCRETIEWELSLLDLPRKPYPNDVLEKLATSGNVFSTRLGGRIVTFGIQTGEGEAAARKAVTRNKTEPLFAALTSRIITVEGIDADDRGARKAWLESLDMADVLELTESFEEYDGGVRTDIEIRCGACELEQTVNLPLGSTFWLPRRRK